MKDASEPQRDSPSGKAAPRYDQGYRWDGDDTASLAEVLDAAFEYRGNVTLFTHSAGEVVGYLFNREIETEEPFVDILPAAGGRQRVAYSDIRGVAFTGKDTAAGRSWETWVQKYNSKKAAEARGEQVGSIDLLPEELD